jgi:hypothetical protein
MNINLYIEGKSWQIPKGRVSILPKDSSDHVKEPLSILRFAHMPFQPTANHG